MATAIDVLAVMDADARAVACVIDECRSLAREASWRAHLAEHDQARAAVAELIEENKLLRAKARNWDALLAARATTSADSEDCHWKERARQGLIMDAIRECRAMHGYSLTEARDCVQGYVARVGGGK